MLSLRVSSSFLLDGDNNNFSILQGLISSWNLLVMGIRRGFLVDDGCCLQRSLPKRTIGYLHFIVSLNV